MHLNQSKPEIVSSFISCWFLNQTNEQYHADKTAVSSTSLKEILQSPFAFLLAHNGTFKKADNDAFRLGTAIHMAILEPKLFANSYVIMPKFSGVGSVIAREEWKESLPKQTIILKPEEYEELQHMIEAVKNHKDAANLLKGGQAETSGYFRDPETGIKCRIRPDFLHASGLALIDVKSTRSIFADDFSRTILTYKYYFQMAFYCHGIKQITGKNIDFPLFLAVQKVAPYEVALYQADKSMMEKGELEVKAALAKLKECIESNQWVSYQQKVQEINLPVWAMRGDF